MPLTAKAYAEGGRAHDLLHRHKLLDKRASTTPTRRCVKTSRGGGIAPHADRQGLHHRQRPHLRPTPPHAGAFGGHGFIKEWGAYNRCATTASTRIYEGTQHHPVAGFCWAARSWYNGATLKKFGKLIAALIEEEGVNEKMAEFINPLACIWQTRCTASPPSSVSRAPPDEVGAAAVDHLRVAAIWCLATWPRMQVALREVAAGNAADPFHLGRCRPRVLLRHVPETATLDAHRALARR
jgi:hypothetical protein